MTVIDVELAPAKVNLCLYLGPTRDDGRHELVTVFDAISLCDELTVSEGDGADEVVCAGVHGRNLVEDALVALRHAHWAAPPVRIDITKRIPVAAGMGGGSADAAAMLRLAPRLAPVEAATVTSLAARLGSDVPSQLVPGPSVGTGAGDEIDRGIPEPAPYGVLVLPQPFGLSTPDVYREADRLGLPRTADDLSGVLKGLRRELSPALIVNDLQRAALSLAPQIGNALEAAGEAGADVAMVCGSGPTVIGLFWGRDGADGARDAADRLGWGIAAAPVRGGVGA